MIGYAKSNFVVKHFQSSDFPSGVVVCIHPAVGVGVADAVCRGDDESSIEDRTCYT